MVIKTFQQFQLPNDPAAVLQASTKQYSDAGDAAKAALVHTHAESDVTSLTTDLSGKASSTHTHAESDVTSLTTDLAAKAPLSGPTFTGTTTFAKAVYTPVALTDASVVTVDASLGNTFRLALTASSHSMGNPSNSSDGQLILFEITSGGAFTFGWGSNYAWGSDVAVPILSQATGKIDYVLFIYNSTAAKWRGLSFARGY